MVPLSTFLLICQLSARAALGCQLAIVVVLCFIPSSALAQFTLYSIGVGDNNLRAVNPANGATLSSVPVTLTGKTVTVGTGLATDPTTGKLWALVRTNLSATCRGGNGGRIPELVTVDASTGIATSIGDPGDCFSALAFRPDGTLYGVTGHGADTPDTLYTLNKTTAAKTFVMSLPDDGGQALAFNPNDGLLYHASGFTANHFESINPQTLAQTPISLSGFSYVEAAALAFSPSENLFFMTDTGIATLSFPSFMTVTTGGVVTSRGTLDHFPKGLAFAPTVSCPGASLQTAINDAQPGAVITVAGTCNENILVRNEKQRILIDGSGISPGTRAAINGGAGSPTFNVRGKGIVIANFVIAGGDDGVNVNRGSNAVLNNNIIQNALGNGVVINELAFAALTNNTIQNNGDAGVWVSENSTARIGFNADTDSAASPNTIQGNAVGILVSNGSSARIIGNTIASNTEDGIRVQRDSHADIASNTISSNAEDGVEVDENSVVQLGEDAGSTIFEAANSTGSNNTGFGVRCTSGGAVDGRLGSLNGNLGAIGADASCIDSSIP